MVDASSLPGYLTVSQVAQRLDVSVRRVSQLISSGELPADRLGSIYVVREADVERRLSLGPAEGRRLTAPHAWGVLSLASGDRAPWLTPSARYRLGKLLRRSGLAGLRPRLVERGTLRGFRLHPSLLPMLRQDPALMLSGVTAAAELRLGLLAGETIDAYVGERELPTVIARHQLRESRDSNVILRVVPSFAASWPPSHVAPAAAVALDLLEDDDPRSRQVGKELLGRLSS